MIGSNVHATDLPKWRPTFSQAAGRRLPLWWSPVSCRWTSQEIVPRSAYGQCGESTLPATRRRSHRENHTGLKDRIWQHCRHSFWIFYMGLCGYTMTACPPTQVVQVKPASMSYVIQTLLHSNASLKKRRADSSLKCNSVMTRV